MEPELFEEYPFYVVVHVDPRSVWGSCILVDEGFEDFDEALARYEEVCAKYPNAKEAFIWDTAACAVAEW